jgi:Ni2+-binding GTPase involved in maturation of urease and hydrogenase
MSTCFNCAWNHSRENMEAVASFFVIPFESPTSIMIAGPSNSGKTSLCMKILENYQNTYNSSSLMNKCSVSLRYKILFAHSNCKWHFLNKHKWIIQLHTTTNENCTTLCHVWLI